MIYLDNAATTRPNQRALKRAEQYLSEKYFNPSALYQEGFSLHLELKETREKLCSYLADCRKYDLVFTSCGTESDNTAVFGYGRRGNIVTTEGEHAAVLSAVAEQKARGVEVRYAPLNRDGSVKADALLDLVDEKTSLVSVIHVNNETGAVNDVNAIARAVKQKNKNAVFHTDGVQSFGKIPFKSGEAIDLYSFSAHKIGGLKGTGALIVKKSLPFRPFVFGGGQESGRRSGTENVFGIKMLSYAAEEKFASLQEDYDRVARYKDFFIQNLNKEIFSVLSPETGSPYIISLAAKNCRGEILLHMADDKGLMIGTGSACSSNSKKRYSRVILACGYAEAGADTVLRVSLSNETTETEVKDAVQILNQEAGKLAAKMG